LPTLREAGLENANRETDACGSPDTAIRSDRFRDATSSCPPTGRSALDRRFPARVPAPAGWRPAPAWSSIPGPGDRIARLQIRSAGPACPPTPPGTQPW